MAKKAGLVWIDAQGERVLNVVTTVSGVGAIETALANHSNAGVLECWEGLDEVYNPTPATTAYVSVRQTAALYFTDGLGSSATLYIPAADQSIFGPDGITVDPSTISDIIVAAVGSLVCGSGNPATAFTGGQLIATRISGIATVY